MNDLSSRVDTPAGTPSSDAATSTPSIAELVRRAESVRATLFYAAVLLVIALTVVVQSTGARRAAEQRSLATSTTSGGQAERVTPATAGAAGGTHVSPKGSK